MQPLHKLLARIRWDPRFGEARFEIGYYDRIERRVLVIPLTDIYFPRAQRFVFEIWDADGVLHRIPFHRVRSVYRDGRLIWKRPAPEPR